MDSPSPDFSSWPPFLQWLAGLGAIVGGAILWIMGQRKPTNAPIQPQNDEVTRLRHQADLGKLRGDFELALSATRKQMYDRINEVEDRHQKLREQVIRLEERMRQRRTS